VAIYSTLSIPTPTGHFLPKLISSAWVHRRSAQPFASLAEVAEAVSVEDAVAATQLCMPGELAKHGKSADKAHNGTQRQGPFCLFCSLASPRLFSRCLVFVPSLPPSGVSEGLKAVKKFEGAQGQQRYRPPRARAGLQFCVRHSAWLLWQQTGASTESPSNAMLRTAVFMTAVTEYLCAEILELAGNAARDNRKTYIIPRHIHLAIRNDEELDKQFKDFAFLGGGVLPVSNTATFLPFALKSQSLKIDAVADAEHSHGPAHTGAAVSRNTRWCHRSDCVGMRSP
jgi:histone H2A